MGISKPLLWVMMGTAITVHLVLSAMTSKNEKLQKRAIKKRKQIIEAHRKHKLPTTSFELEDSDNKLIWETEEILQHNKGEDPFKRGCSSVELLDFSTVSDLISDLEGVW